MSICTFVSKGYKFLHEIIQALLVVVYYDDSKAIREESGNVIVHGDIGKEVEPENSW